MSDKKVTFTNVHGDVIAKTLLVLEVPRIGERVLVNELALFVVDVRWILQTGTGNAPAEMAVRVVLDSKDW